MNPVYHIYTHSLTQSPFHNDYSTQVHKLGEIEKWIPHIKKTNFGVVLFSPVFKAKTHGYDTTDFTQIDNRIGTNEEFKSLVDKFHKNGIKVWLDAVLNHCGRDFFAFQDVLKNKQNSKYCGWFQGLNWGGNTPYNDGFSYDTWSGYYELVKFNLQNPECRNYIISQVLNWIEYYGVDGFRLDAANTLDFGFMSELRKNCPPHVYLMGEVVHGEYPRWVNQNTLNSVTNYIVYKALYSSHNSDNIYELANTLQNQARWGGDVCTSLYNFLDNHDQPRIASILTKPEFLKTAYILTYTIPGVPSVYYGSEWGIKGVKENGNDQPLRPYINIDEQKDNETTELVAKLCEIYTNHTALQKGSYLQTYLQYREPFAYEREYNGEKILTIVNIGGEDKNFNLQGGEYVDLLTDEKFTSGNITIKANDGKILLHK